MKFLTDRLIWGKAKEKKKKKEKQKSLAIWQAENVKRSAFFIFEAEGKPDKFCIPFPPANLSVSITHSFYCARGIWQRPHASVAVPPGSTSHAVPRSLSHSGSIYLAYMFCDLQAISCHETRERLRGLHTAVVLVPLTVPLALGTLARI